MKNIVDAFDAMYSAIKNKHAFLKRMFIYSCERYLIRSIANWMLPVYFTLTAGMKKYSLSDIKKEKRVIVSLTSFPFRISKLWLVIETLLRQSYKPDMIILWLSKEQFPSQLMLPKKLLKLKERGLDIRLVDMDIRSHKKYYYAFSEYPDDIIITVDDDIFYPSSTIADLLEESSKYLYPVVVARYFSVITWDTSGNLLPYVQWKHTIDEPTDAIFFGSGGGTLFPPGTLYKDVCNRELFQELTPLADDVWLNAMCRLQGTKIVATNHLSTSILPVMNLRDVALADDNLGCSLNDKQIQSVREFYAKNKIDPFVNLTNSYNNENN